MGAQNQEGSQFSTQEGNIQAGLHNKRTRVVIGYSSRRKPCFWHDEKSVLKEGPAGIDCCGKPSQGSGGEDLYNEEGDIKVQRPGLQYNGGSTHPLGGMGGDRNFSELKASLKRMLVEK